MNYIDIVFIIILALYCWHGYRYGFIVLLARSIGFIGGLVFALAIYQWAGRILVQYTSIPLQFAYMIAFIALFTIGQGVIGYGLRRLLERTPIVWHQNIVNRLAGVVPGFIDGLIFLALIVLIVVMLPVPARINESVTNSYIGNYIINAVPTVEDYSRKIFGSTIEESLTQFAFRPGPNDTVSIPFKPKSISIDEVSERRMLELINEERAKVGAKPVVIDTTITEVARAHSRDMWERKYFAHNNPDGEDPFKRMSDGGVKFITAGENLAFAPTVAIAHQGLMNSPGHKRNILDPAFGRVGIGVISGGIYGKMFTQNFAN
ncbi:MAG: CvpA family protein [bacterium]|nr:CvpA family protein [bacterium]